MKKYILTLLTIIIPLVQVAAVPHADEAYREHQRLYKKAEKHLIQGTARQKVNAALFLGARRNSRYLRPLGEELLLELDVKSPYIKQPQFDPYVKSQIAWALGQLRHKRGVPYLLRALHKTAEIIKRQNQILSVKEKESDSDYKKARAQKKSSIIANHPVKNIILPEDRPGPYLFSKKHAVPYSPDIYWNIADRFKKIMSPSDKDAGHQMMRHGFTYMNLIFHIFDAIGVIYDAEPLKERIKQDHINSVANYLKNPFPYIRGAAAVTLGNISAPGNLAILEKHFNVEKNQVVRVKVAFAILGVRRSKYKHLKFLTEALESEDENIRFAAAVGLRDLGFGESLVYLRAAYRIENRILIRRVLEKAIENARLDDLMPTE